MMSDDFSNETYREWETRDWVRWLEEKLTFPFTVKRTDDADDFFFTDIARREYFRLGHTMKVLKLSYEDNLYGIIVKVREKRRVGSVPLCDLKVIPKDDRNSRPVKEYAVWFANR